MDRKTIIITGASRGLGAEAARIAAGLGANVVVNARSEADLQQVAAQVEAAGGRALAVPGDVSRVEDCERLIQQAVDRFGQLDALVNNAGILHPIARIAESDPAAWRKNILVNLVGPYYLTRFALQHLRPRRGRVINVSSGAAVSVVEGWSAYCAAKAGINHFTRVLAAEEEAIVAIAFRPGVVDTEMQRTIREEGRRGMTARSHERFIRRHQQGELLPPEVPGRALAVLALHAPHAWSGEFMQWDEGRVQTLVVEKTSRM